MALRGALERADRLGVVGWARAGTAPLTLLVTATGRAPMTLRADRYRADLAAAGEGDGDCAFEAWFDPPLPAGMPAEIRARVAGGADLAASPWHLAAAPASAHGIRRPDLGAKLALVVDEAAPDPARDAGSVALLAHMAELRRFGFQVVFATLAEADDAVARTAGRVRVAYLHRLRPMALLAAALRAANPGIQVIYAVADLAHLRAAREAAVLGGGAPPGLRTAELAAAQAADAVVTHSPAEAALLEREVPGVRAHWVPWTVRPRPVTEPFATRSGIAFLASYGHAPNLDAARVLLDEVMPAVWARAGLRCVLAGSGMPAWLRRRAGGLVEIIDDLPDTALLWRQLRVSAAPLRFGAGVKGKVLDSLAAGIPCACSPVAAEGLALPPALVAADMPSLAALLLRLHEDERANSEAATAGLGVLAARHTDVVVQRALGWALTRPIG